MYNGTHCTNGTDKIAKIDFFIIFLIGVVVCISVCRIIKQKYKKIIYYLLFIKKLLKLKL